MAAAARLNRVLNQYQFGKLTKEELKSRIRSGAFGRIIGIIGPFVCRYQKCRQIISDRAIMFRKSMSSAAIQGRSNFASKVKFAKFLNNNEEIKTIWTIADIDGRLAWQRIIKHNNIKELHPTKHNSITPGTPHFYIDQSCSLNEDFSIKNHYKCSEQEKLILIMVPYDPVNKGDEPFSIFQITNNQLSEEQIELCSRFKKYIMYSAVIRMSDNGIEWSNTAAVEGAFKTSKKVCGEELVLHWLVTIQDYISSEYSETKKKPFRQNNYVLRL